MLEDAYGPLLGVLKLDAGDSDAFLNLLIDQQEAIMKIGEAAADKQPADLNDDFRAQMMAQIEEQLTKDQQAIGQLEQEMQDKVLAKREELLGPILEKIDVVIKEIGKEGGYTFIFDASVQISVGPFWKLCQYRKLVNTSAGAALNA